MANRLRSLTLAALAALAACAVVVPAANGAFVKWRFEVAGQYILQPPAVAPDGTVAVVGSSGNLYSLTPNGALRWMVPGVGGHGGPSFGPDGTVYVGVDRRITAVAPNGTIRWSFLEPAGGQGIIAGPTVGPDGNVYVITDYGGLGAFALSPQGAFVWSNAGSPVFTEYGQLGAEVVFGAGRLFAAFDEYGAAPTSILYALTLGGTQTWAVPVPTSNDVFM
jgi:outer membrane protein assembly factor BamB